jgi:hypothetical protein
MSYVADVEKQHLQGQSLLRSIAHMYTVTKPQNKLNINKGQCNLQASRIDFKEGVCYGFPKKAL